MKRYPIPFEKFVVKAHALWADQWLVLTAGDFHQGDFNAMTVGWGSFGTMWSKPFVQVVVRPVRYTYAFMERYDTFTLCAFAEQYRAAVESLGMKSGRNCNKIAEAKLTPIAVPCIAAPGLDEAELIIECRKMYWDDFNPAHFLNPHIEKNYPLKDYHRMYFGEILAISGVGTYSI